MSKKQPQAISRKVLLRGVRPMMFDRYAGDNKTELPPEAKMYLKDDCLTIPVANILSMLGAQNTNSAAKMFGGRGYKKLAMALQGFVSISPDPIFLKEKGKKIPFTGFGGKINVDNRVARLDKGVPNPKARPVLALPWELEFDLEMFANDEFQEQTLLSMFEKAGIAIGLGTYRGVYGKFLVDKWE